MLYVLRSPSQPALLLVQHASYRSSCRSSSVRLSSSGVGPSMLMGLVTPYVAGCLHARQDVLSRSTSRLNATSSTHSPVDAMHVMGHCLSACPERGESATVQRRGWRAHDHQKTRGLARTVACQLEDFIPLAPPCCSCGGHSFGTLRDDLTLRLLNKVCSIHFTAMHFVGRNSGLCTALQQRCVTATVRPSRVGWRGAASVKRNSLPLLPFATQITHGRG